MYFLLEDIVVISQTSGGSRHSEVSILWQHHILRADTQLEILVVVGHAVVDEHGQGVFVVLDLGCTKPMGFRMTSEIGAIRYKYPT